MITAAGAEGISLQNCRFVHITEPYWHPVRTRQVIGRARRICSHSTLPKEFQTVKVFQYIMVFSEEQKKSKVSAELRKFEWINLHWYKKDNEFVGRKLGHLTVLLQEEDFSSRREEAIRALEIVRSIWPMPSSNKLP